MNEQQEQKEFGIRLISIRDFKNKDFTKSNNFLNSFYEDLNLREIKIINTLLYVFSTYSKITKNDEIKKGWFTNVFEKEGFFGFHYQELIKLMNCDKTNITLFELEENLENIRKKSLKYIKFNDTQSIKTYTSFITKFQIIKQKDLFNNEIMKDTTINIYFDKNLYQDIFEYTKVGYTLLNIDINKIKSKMGIGLYEELKRITPLKQIKKKSNSNYSVSNKFKQIHSYTLEELNSICGTNYKYLSKIMEGLEVQYKKLIQKNLVNDIYKFHISNKKIEIEIIRMRFENDDDIF